MNNVMHTETSIWTLDETSDKWIGKCKECKGEKAQYTPEVLAAKGIKPCGTCNTIKKE